MSYLTEKRREKEPKVVKTEDKETECPTNEQKFGTTVFDNYSL